MTLKATTDPSKSPSPTLQHILDDDSIRKHTGSYLVTLGPILKQCKQDSGVNLRILYCETLISTN
ncbi:MAG: hypothetical protein ACM3UY_04310 [Methanocella sp.]